MLLKVYKFPIACRMRHIPIFSHRMRCWPTQTGRVSICGLLALWEQLCAQKSLCCRTRGTLHGLVVVVVVVAMLV